MARERTEAQMKAQEEMDRRRHERREATRVAHERIGLPLICCEQVCRRARRCLGRVEDGEYDLLPCLWHYREEMRFLMPSPHGLRSMLEEAERLGIVPPFDPAAEEAEATSPAPTDSTARRRRPREPTLIEIVFGSGAVLARLRKPKGTWRPPSWEEDPERSERYFESGDWRDPGCFWRGSPWGSDGRRARPAVGKRPSHERGGGELDAQDGPTTQRRQPCDSGGA